MRQITKLLATSLLTAHLASALRIASQGHWNPLLAEPNFKDIQDCVYTYPVLDEGVTCADVASANAISSNALKQLNSWLSCEKVLTPPVFVCVPSAPPTPVSVVSDKPNTKADSRGNSTTATQSASVTKALNETTSISASATPAVVIPSPSPSPVCVSTTTCSESQCGTTITDTCGNPLTCPECPCVPSTTCTADQCGQKIVDNCGNDLWCQDCPPPPPPPPSTCSIADGSCRIRAQSDSPPNVAGTGMVYECVTLANYARQHYNPGVNDLVWSNSLAAYAQQSADYSATYNCWDCHTNSGPGTTWGQNLYLSKKSCSEAYYGWVTNEALGNDASNPDAGHFTNVVGFASPYVYIGCSVSTIKAGATVCNYGLSNAPRLA
ncbi:hypothetical protein BDR26DRAFT_861296 [Obelidium mucronatum]|nr:hypothetical protein BDR26DRAFT_861296 [Obelidium mucronatum]